MIILMTLIPYNRVEICLLLLLLLLLLLWRQRLAQRHVTHVASFSYDVQRFTGQNLRHGTTGASRRTLVWHSMSVCDVNRTTISSIWSYRALSSQFLRSSRSLFSRDVQIASDLVGLVIIVMLIERACRLHVALQVAINLRWINQPSYYISLRSFTLVFLSF